MHHDVPALPHDEIHVWRMAWSGAIEPPFAALLAAYAGPDAPAVERGEHGKPLFPAPWNTLGFSWSHSRDTALFAVGRGTPGFELGVDVERVRPRPKALELAGRFFAPDETSMLGMLAPEAVLPAFLSLWTAKEAVLKAHGGGLSYGLHRVAFSLVDNLACPARFEGEVAPAAAWQVHPLALGEGTLGAVAWRGAERRIRVFTSGL